MHLPLAFSLAIATSQAAYLNPRQATCTLGHPNGYTCGLPGSLTKPDQATFLSNTNAKTLEKCRDRCLVNPSCEAHWYNSKTKKCTTSSVGLYKQQFVKDSTSTTTYYNRVCWSGSSCAKPPTTTTTTTTTSTSTPAPTPTPAGLQDGDFENAAQNAGNVWLYSKDGRATIGAPGYNSDNAFHWSADAGVNTALDVVQIYDDVPGQYYLFSFVGRSTPGSSTANFNFGDLVQYLRVDTPSDPTAWTSYEFPVLGLGDRDHLSFLIRSSASQAVSYDFDNFALTPTNLTTYHSPTAPSYITNGNFGDGTLNGWSILYQSAGSNGYVTADPERNAAFSWTAPDGISDVTISTTLTTSLIKGQDYVFSYDYKYTNPSAYPRIHILFGDQGTTLFDYGPQGDGTEWRSYARRVRLLDATSSSFPVTLVSYGAGTILVTNFRISPAE